MLSNAKPNLSSRMGFSGGADRPVLPSSSNIWVMAGLGDELRIRAVIQSYKYSDWSKAEMDKNSKKSIGREVP